MQQTNRPQDGFSLIELLIVIIILGILAAITIPRFLSQRDQANNASAVSDLRNLAVVETSLEAAGGLTVDEDIIAEQGWAGSSDRIRVCAELTGTNDIVLNAWHMEGSMVYTWQRSTSTIQANQVPIEPEGDCANQVGSGNLVWPVTP